MERMIFLQFILVFWLFDSLPRYSTGQEFLPSIDTSECGKTKGCFRSSANCKADECDFVLTWKMDSQGKTVAFEYSSHINEATPWIAVGFSNDTAMAGCSVTDCIVNASFNNDVVIQTSFNPGYYNEVLSPNSKIGLLVNKSSGAFVNGRLRCSFTRLVHTNNDLVADLSKAYYIFIGRGPATEDAVKLKHSVTPTTSPIKVSVSQIIDIHGGKYIIYHASLMIVAWMFVSSIGIIISRHFKNVWSCRLWKKKIWFQIHRITMGLTFALSVSATVVIFLGVSAAPLLSQKLHPLLGMVVICLMSINIIVGFIRPSPASGKRQLFNWVHSLLGNGAHLTAGITMYFGVQAFDLYVQVHPWLKWLVVSYITWRVLIDIIMTVEKYYHREDLRVAYIEMSGSSDDIVIGNKILCFKKIMLAIYLLTLTGFTALTLYGIVRPFYY